MARARLAATRVPLVLPAQAGALPRAFYERHATVVARALLGRLLAYGRGRNRVVARIVETEAYRSRRDPASHAHCGRTPRSAIMFGAPGHAYVYFSYGMHHCLNVVCEPDGRAAAVLVRAVEIVQGEAAARRRRGSVAAAALGRGPGCVTRALGVGLECDGADLVNPHALACPRYRAVCSGPWIADTPPDRLGHRIASGPRVGISRARERPWRYWLRGHPAVSRPVPR